MVFFELYAEKMLCEIGLHFRNIIFFPTDISGFIQNSMSIGFFAHLYVEIIQHEGTMDWLKKVFIAQKAPIHGSFVTTFITRRAKIGRILHIW